MLLEEVVEENEEKSCGKMRMSKEFESYLLKQWMEEEMVVS